MNTNFKKTLLATAVLSATCMTHFTAQAQQTEDEMIEQIVVSGFRGSLIKAKDLKKDKIPSLLKILLTSRASI